MGLTPEREARRHYLEGLGHTGRTNSELDTLNRLKTGSQSDAELIERVRSGLPSGQAEAALRDRGYDVEELKNDE